MYQQKMCYIDLYKNGLKCGNMGHVRLEWDESQYRFQVSLCRLDKQTLVSTMIKRNGEKQQEKPAYEEMCRRFLADSEDFSEEKLKKAGICRRFSNAGSLEECLAEIRSFIKEKKGFMNFS